MFRADYTARTSYVSLLADPGVIQQTKPLLNDASKALRLLSRTDHPPVTVEFTGRVTAREAALLIERGSYRFRIRGGRVRHMSRVPTTHLTCWRTCWRTTQASVFAFWQEAA